MRGLELSPASSRKFLPDKTRHKRQTLQDMTRPLKQWLVKHRENPYPSKQEKIELVKTSRMSMTQVSNWFANARRRLKNTVRGENVSWARRIKDYNQFAEGNAERLNFSSSDEDDDWDSGQDTEIDNQDSSVQSEPARGVFPTLPATALTSSLSDTALTTALRSPPPAQCQMSSPSPARSAPTLEEPPCSRQKFKHSILQRYLQQAVLPPEDVVTSSQRNRHLSSSTGSHDFEYLSTSSVSSPSHEAHQDSFDDMTEDMETIAIKLRPSDTPNINYNDELYWKEISAALALTSLSRPHVTN
ncbi:hypothetical protein Btru_005141 [Bulinus truncatus]|nr:hypothetical protein Btru_005141 [Bulinus truncatus]